MALSMPSLAKECIGIEQAPDYIGKSVCVKGKILRVVETESGTSTFLNFCEDYRKCPFTVVVFDRDLSLVGDVRALEGQEIEIFGKIKKWKGCPEIVLKDSRQLEGKFIELPPIPKTYDADRHGRFSAGTFSNARSKHPRHRRTSKPSDGEIDAE